MGAAADAGLIRLGIAGGGIMGERIAAAAAALDGVEVRAVADANPVSRARIAERFGAAAHASWEALVEGGEVDALYVGLPNHLHADAAVAAAEAGLHLLVDKPLCTTLADADRVLAAAARADVRLMVGFSHRFHVELATAKRMLAAGELGDPVLAVDTIVDSAPAGPAWYWDPAAGGGVVQLQMHHSFDRLAWLLGSPVVQVQASVHERPVGDGPAVDVAAAVTLTFANGAVGTSAASFVTGYDGDGIVELAIQGTHGHVRIETWQAIEAQTARFAFDQRQRRDDWLGAELGEFAAAIRERRDPSVSGEDGRRALRVALAALESARTGAAVDVTP
ncbi:Gfo/Idh/MocA family oxidoreductase [Conexibacter sp. JD483]|uniref:Gfo/Idh/MocA family protein n=1 Tax=unclassified Conexibacter TaxID=2627773 RepID=UPI002719B96B|nr:MULTISPECIES: Gfo/Idh/MocA family oxidoreductase [unclassified Conexibacter]MDO8186277.1 Gfo/Idh/MocA family oxidoreductase [Conexibacter sp. CPCC 205706]MDO8197482.1 Gfo/Idh/MocA family oxidoreductase [Conexibacter sp. CPCC 205762]MDR9370265.1 Gfo/Idh/MocA family oxidoreductase [Conexibacter sp. JD483]